MNAYFREAMFEAATMLLGSHRPSILTSQHFLIVSRIRLKSFFTVKALLEGERDALHG